MKYIEFPLVDYIDIIDEKVTIYVHTKDKRVIVLEDVCSNMSLDDMGIYVDHMFLGKRMTFMMPREDFSYVEYYTRPRESVTKKDFDDINSFIEEQIEDFNRPEKLYDDLI